MTSPTPTPTATHGITAECRVYLDENLSNGSVNWWAHLYPNGRVGAHVTHFTPDAETTQWYLEPFPDPTPDWLPEPPAWWTAALNDLRAQGERIKAGAS